MTRHEIISVLREAIKQLRSEHGVASLALFGSVARGDADDKSDVDILVAFTGRASFDNYFNLKERLEEMIGRPVDLVTANSLNPRLGRAIHDELIRVA